MNKWQQQQKQQQKQQQQQFLKISLLHNIWQKCPVYTFRAKEIYSVILKFI
jgi:hypothetical protein